MSVSKGAETRLTLLPCRTAGYQTARESVVCGHVCGDPSGGGQAAPVKLVHPCAAAFVVLTLHFFPPFFLPVDVPLLARSRPVARFSVAGADLGGLPGFP